MLKIGKKNWRVTNPEKSKEKNKNNYTNNKINRLISSKKYQEKNKTKINLKNKNRYHNDLIFKLTKNFRNLIGKSIRKKGYNKNSKTEIILGCTFEEFKQHLESKFEPWMRWDNHRLYNGELNYGWDIDHIVPSSSAVIEDEIIKLNHYTNLQPLCSKVNRDIKVNNLL